MRVFAALCVVSLCSCDVMDFRTVGAPTMANPETAPTRGGQLELLVKTDFDALLSDISAGGGPVIWQAFEIAGVPLEARPARLLQLRGDLPLYQSSPGALTLALQSFALGG